MGFTDPLEYSPLIENQDLLNDKIISTSIKNEEIVIKKPFFKKIKVATLKKRGDKLLFLRGAPILNEIKEMVVLSGFKEEKIKFPVENWFTSSTTSSFLTDEETQIIREIDDLAFGLYNEMIKQPLFDHGEFIGNLLWIKNSIVDAAKGRSGQAVVHAKTSISKTESRGYNYSNDREKEWEQRKKAGLFGLGLGPF